MLVVGETSRPYLKMKNPSIGTYHIEGIGLECKTVKDAIRFRKDPLMQKIMIDDLNGEDYYQQGDVFVWPKNAKKLKFWPKVLT